MTRTRTYYAVRAAVRYMVALSAGLVAVASTFALAALFASWMP